MFASSFFHPWPRLHPFAYGPNSHPSILVCVMHTGVLEQALGCLSLGIGEAFCIQLQPLSFQVCWKTVFGLFPKKQSSQNPDGFVIDGGDLMSEPDWSRPL